MKNFKKVLALVLALSMVLSTMTAFAAEYEAEGDALYDLGLLQGYSTTEKDLGLEDALSREAAMKLIVTMMGWEVDMDATSDFTDVSEWAQPYVAVAVEKGITNGISATEFGTDQATRVQLLTWYVRALGYEVEWVDADQFETDVFTYASELELGSLDELLNLDEAVLRGDLAGVAYAALTADVNDSETTLIEDLVEAGVVEEEEALELGLVEEEAPVAFEVDTVDPIGLAQTLVVFTTAVDGDTVDTDDFEFDGDEALTVEVTDDDKAVIVTHKEVENGAKVDVEIANIDDADGESLEDVEFENVYYLDKDFPEVLDVEVFGDREIRVVFSEMMESNTSVNDDLSHEYTDGDFDVDKAEINEDGFTVYKESGKKAGIKVVKRNPNNFNAVDITLSADLNDGETYTIKIDADVTDFAGYGVYDEVTVDVELITEAPEVVSYDVDSSTEVTITFDRDVTIADNDHDKFYHTNSKNTVNEDPSADGTDVTLKFDTDEELPEGTAYIYLEEDSIEDLYGNPIGTIKVTIEREEDVTAPIVTDVEQTSGADNENKYFKITLDDTDVSDSYKDEDIYTVYDEDGEEVDVKDAKLNSDGDVITIELKDPADAGEYTVVIDGLEDKEGNDMDKSEFIFEMSDEIRPTLDTNTTKVTYHSVAGDLVIRIEYPKEMASDGDYSVTDASKYQLVDGTTLYDVDEDIDDLDIELSDEEDVVIITIPDNADNSDFCDGSNGVATGGWDLVISRVADASGNLSNQLFVSLNINDGTNPIDLVLDDEYDDGLGVSEYWVRAISDTEIEVKIDGKVSVDDDDFVLYYGSVTAGQELDINVNDEYDDGDTIVTIELDEYSLNADCTVDINDTTLTGQSLLLKIDGPETANGTIDDFENTLAIYPTLPVYDFIAPQFDADATEEFVPLGGVAQGTEIEVDSSTQSPVKYTLVFDEPITSSSALTATDIKIEFDGDYLVAGEDYDIDTTTGNVEISFIFDYPTDTAEVLDGRYTVSVEGADYITDDTGNELNYIEDFEFEFDIEFE